MLRTTRKQLKQPAFAAAFLTIACVSAAAQPAQPPGVWTNAGISGESIALARSEPGLNEPLRHGYAVCNADRTHSVGVRYAPSNATEHALGPRQCFGIDRPIRFEIVSWLPAGVTISGVFQAYRWGTFGRPGKSFPLGEDGVISPPGKSPRPHAISTPREQSAPCKPLSPKDGASQEFYSVCKIGITRLANYRLCFPADYLGGGKHPVTAIVLIRSAVMIEQGAPPLFRSAVAPESCIDMHETHEGYILVGPRTKTADADPAAIASIKLTIRTIRD